jgi:hypothetical protein
MKLFPALNSLIKGKKITVYRQWHYIDSRRASIAPDSLWKRGSYRIKFYKNSPINIFHESVTEEQAEIVSIEPEYQDCLHWIKMTVLIDEKGEKHSVVLNDACINLKDLDF